MKKFKFLLVVLAAILLIPFGVFAEESVEDNIGDVEEISEDVVDNQVNLYFFNGNGCSHCAEAEAWFEEIESEYGEYFNLVSYEVWYNEENNDLMQKVGELRGETVNGVPYIIIGNQSWSGFADDYKEEIISKIKSEYEQDPADRYDIMNYVDLLASDEDESYGSDVLALILILVVGGAVVTGIVLARKNSN